MADAPRTQLHRLENAVRRVGLAGVQRDRQTGVARQRERARVFARRVAELGTGEVEADHATAVPAQRQAHRTFGFGGRQFAHRTNDQTARQGAACQAFEKRLDGGVAAHAVRLEEQRRNAELGEHGAVGARVFGGFEGDARQALRRCHRGHRQRKSFQVGSQTPGVRAALEPGLDARPVLRRQRQATPSQQIDQRRDAQATVQMIVQHHLGHGAQVQKQRVDEVQVGVVHGAPS